MEPKAEKLISNTVSTPFAALFLFGNRNMLVDEPQSNEPIQVFRELM